MKTIPGTWYQYIMLRGGGLLIRFAKQEPEILFIRHATGFADLDMLVRRRASF